jgi:predicted metal-dependent hydrolase
MYVALHELAHVISKSHGHNNEFKKNFAILLRDASRKKIYDPRKNIPTTYCGVGPNE